MAYIYRLELHYVSSGVLHRYGPFRHPEIQEILDLYYSEWADHIRSIEPDYEIFNLFAGNNMSHETACFGCRSIDDLYNYMGEFILQVCASNGFSIYRYEVPDSEVYDGQYQSMFSRQYHKCGMNMGRLIIREAA